MGCRRVFTGMLAMIALQDDVWEVQYGGYHLQKGWVEEELVQFLMDSEKADQSEDSSVE